MSVLNHSPRILTNGLIYCVDAAAKQSYSDGSSTWKNIVDNNLYKGTIANATHVWQGGAGAGASYFSFDGTGDEVTGEANVTPATGPFSLSIWIKVNEAGSAGGRGGVFDRNSGGAFNGVSLGKGGSNNWAFVVSGTSNHSNRLLVDAASYPTVGEWACWCGTYNGSTSISYYKNEDLQGTDSGTDQGNLDTQGTRNDVFALASRTTEFLDCEIAHVAVYNIQLSHEQVKQNYRALKGRFGL